MDVSNAQWVKSSYSGSNGGNCVEVTAATGVIAVRDSKDPDGPKLLFTPAEWNTFLHNLKSGGR
ncbi:DUF397 domain-containing protein [Spongiactinospora sp. TRM90649]|uniref:DUF397 domain-containing protein n=1 Tax=Spongiactinospora sp. TRM90649 TaxID=3031114 RepID=UPI0023F923C5|nr:DUF397 domain-containing protein [Spongiactinospora sp. TRM90649]MDF5756469.1 DUF397 domain-containing protein [Spongiactinospora sp. TRM90649]